MKVKICGITTAQEVKYINKLKPEYIGFVFTKSKRQISIARAKELINKLDKDILAVGVFKDNSIDEIENITREVKLDVIQLHGCEDEEFIENLRFRINDVVNEENRNEIRDEFSNVINMSRNELSKNNQSNVSSKSRNFNVRTKSGKFDDEEILIEEIKIWKGISIKNEEDVKKAIVLNVDNLILDGGNPGSGESFNWDLISGINKNKNFFLAGGVGLNNIDEIVNNIKPYGIDVSSGVESVDSYGISKKDYYKMKILIEKVRKKI